MSNLRIPPQNIEAEKALLGSIMLRPDAINEVLHIISPDAFYSEKHRIIYRTMLELFNKSTPIDLLSLSSRLKEKNEIEKVGGSTYLTELVDAVPSASNVKHYADLVHKKSLMRGLILASEFISQLGFDESQEIESILDQAEKKIFEVTNVSTNQTYLQIKDTLDEAWERLDELSKSDGSLRGVPTGYKALDEMLSGFQKSDLVILAARPSMGKTSFALDVARRSAVNHDVSVGIFSLEMGAQQLVDRMLAAEAGIDGWKLRTGRLRSEDFEQVREAMGRLNHAPIFFDDTPGNNIFAMRSVARRWKTENNLGLVIVDYLQLMTPTNSRNSDNVVQQVTEISRSLKSLARELDVPVIALSQLSRAVESRGGRPRLSDLRDSGSIEQDADVVMFIHNETRYAKEPEERSNITEILIEKHRNGPTGKIDLYFDPGKTSFSDLDATDYGSNIDSF